MPPRRYSNVEALLARVLTFAQADLATWRDGDWLNAREDLPLITFDPEVATLRRQLPIVQRALRDLIDALGGTASAPGLPMPGRGLPPTAHIAAGLSLLRNLSAGGVPIERVRQAEQALLAPARGTEEPLALALRGTLTLRRPPERRGPFLLAYAVNARSPDRELEMAAQWAACTLLAQVDADRVRRCRECARWFVAKRRTQEYDTPRCATRQRVRAFERRHQAARRRAQAAVETTLAKAHEEHATRVTRPLQRSIVRRPRS